MHFAFRSEFRPLDILQLIFSPVSHPYRGNTTDFDGFCLAVFGFVVWFAFWGCGLGFGVGLVSFFPSICSVSYPSMITWAHRPHGVRTRGKKAQQDMDLKSAFAPAVPRQPFFEPFWVGPASTRSYLRLRLGCGPPCMPHKVPGVFSKLLHRCQGFNQDDVDQATETVSGVPPGCTWFRPKGTVGASPFGQVLQKTHGDLSKVDLELPEGLLIGLEMLPRTLTVPWTSTWRKVRLSDQGLQVHTAGASC